MLSILKLLQSEAGYISAAMAIGSMIANGVQGSQAKKRAAKLTHKTGEEQNFQDFLGAGTGNEIPLTDQQKTMQEGLSAGMDAAKAGGLYPAISEAFSQRPNSAEYDAIANQEKNLKNTALNTGARGGLLKQQMFEAAKNAASNKLGVMENARQNALQRAFQIFQPQAPTQAANSALNQQQLQGLGAEAQLGVERNKMALGGATEDASGTGGGLGSILGGTGGGGLSSIITSLFGGGGAISNAVGGSPSFSMPMAGQGFSNIFMGG